MTKLQTSCTKHQGGQVLCCSLQGCRSSQRLGIHGGEDAMETRQRSGLHTLHSKGEKRGGKKTLRCLNGG